MNERVDNLEKISRWITFSVFVITVLAYFAAPMLALSWRNLPFPGFLLEQTLVVNDRIGNNWQGRLAGVEAPQLVTRLAAVPINSIADFHQILTIHKIGDVISVFTVYPDEQTRFYSSITLSSFSKQDMFNLFWLPYLIGLAYLGIAIWVYLASGSTRPGRALAFFSVCAALSCGLLFDVLSTHKLIYIWVLAIAQLGGAITSLALRFPVEWKPVRRHAWLLAVPYFISIGLGIWAIISLNFDHNPWAYITARSASYLYVVIGVGIFLIMMLYRVSSSSSIMVRRQARIILLGSGFAFIPIVGWFIATILNKHIAFNGAILLPGLLLFPISVGLAIVRYRLLEIDSLVNRAIVYSLLTTILAGVFTASIAFSQRLFIAVTGEKSDAAIVMTTLIVAATTSSLKPRVQSYVDRYLKESVDNTKSLKQFGDQVNSYIQMTDKLLLSKRLLEEAAVCLDATCGAVLLRENEEFRLCNTYGNWINEASVRVPIEWQEEKYGILLLGARKENKPYRKTELECLHQVSNRVAQALWLNNQLNNHTPLSESIKIPNHISAGHCLH